MIPTPKPPKLATWLMRSLGSGPHLDAIVGDLRERFQMHPSRSWFWRQVLLTIILGALEEIRAHKILALRALLMAWTSMFVIFSYGNRPMNRLSYLMVWSEWAILSVPEWLRSAFWNIGVLPISYFGLLVGGFVLGVSHRRSRNAMILLFIATVLVVMAAFTGWIEWTKPGFRFVRAWMFLALPSAGYHWRLGFILGPLAILIGGIVGAGLRRSASRLVASQSEDLGSTARH